MLDIVLWDVDHGSAALITTPTGKRIAIDLGQGSFSSGATFSPLRHLYHSYGVRYLDLLILTHPHRDHLDDIGHLNLVPPRLVWANRSIRADYITKGNREEDGDIIRQYLELLAYAGELVPAAQLPSNYSVWGCGIEIFTPVYTGSNLNNYSLVTVVSYAGSKIIIPGDNESPSWKSLLDQPAFVRAITGANLFVASHHGRESGYYADLFQYFKPNLVFISDTSNVSTSATSSYYNHAQGWQLGRRSTGQRETDLRYCVTTRTVGYIRINCYQQDGGNFLSVSIA